VVLLLTVTTSILGTNAFSEPINEFDDIRYEDISDHNLSYRPELIATLTFNQETVWPEPDKMPTGIDPNKLMADAMNPGLGVRQLHQQGITGVGVNVAIIDQPIYLDHPEYAGKIAAYYDTGCSGPPSSMHGPAVVSLLVGTNCGTAPNAQVYYAAAPSWEMDASYYVEALDWIIEQNKFLTEAEKIRVVSVSAVPSQPSWANGEMWTGAIARAEAVGIVVLDCSDDFGFIGPCWYDASDPENIARCTPGFPGKPPWFDPGGILVPSSPRTTAQHEDSNGRFSYIYWGRGGLSWSIPYCAGVLAMGWQIRPKLTGEQMRDLLFHSAYINSDGARIINPKGFIGLVVGSVEPSVTPPTGPLFIEVSASATQLCRPDYSHKLDVSWKVTGGTPPYDVTIEITGPDGATKIHGVDALEGTRKFDLAYPGGGAVSVDARAKDSSGSSASAMAGVSLSPCKCK